MHKVKSRIKAGIDILIHHCSFSIILVNAIILLINTIILYQLIPILLNYPPDYMEYSKSFSIAYWLQFAILAFLCLALTSVFTLALLHKVDHWHEISSCAAPDREEKLSAIRSECINLPYTLYFYQIVIPALVLLVYSVIYSFIYKYSLYSFLHIILIVMTFFSFTALINFLFTKKIFTEILYRISVYNRLEGRRINLRRKILLQILPISIVSIFFTSMLGYSRLIEDRGNSLFKLYSVQLENGLGGISIKDVGDIEGRLKKIDVEGTKSQYFILKPDGELLCSGKTDINRFFIQYMKKSSGSRIERIYDEAMSYNGAVIKIKSNSGIWSAGVRYKLTSSTALTFMEGNFIILVLLILLIIYLSARTLTADISTVTSSLEEIAAGWNIKSSRRIPITLNDEIGELVLAINKIRDCEHQYDTLKNEFIANISHEFRTPLNIILNALQLTSRYVKRSSNQEDAARINAHMGTMRQNCYRLLKLINNMIDSTKLDASFFRIYKQNCNIVSDVRNLTSSVSDYIKDKQINLKFESNADKKVIAVDPDAMERIMLNLLSNAVKFSKKGSTITVSVTDRAEFADISVKDTGVGIPEEKLQLIFKRFTQVGSILTKSHEGSGIGLAIVKSLVEMHNGSISVMSRQGEGTEFIITLPVEVLPIQLEGEGDRDHYENKYQSGIEKIDIEFSDL